MTKQIPKKEIEIIQDFIQESKERIEQLHPIIIELSKSCQVVNCWEIMKCENTGCIRYNKIIQLPCWLHTGYIEGGLGVCIGGVSKQDCLICKVFQVTNGSNKTINSIFRIFHSIKGSADFLGLHNILKVTHTTENLLSLIRSGSICLSHKQIGLLCETADFTKEALDYLEEHLNDNEITAKAEAIISKLQHETKEAVTKIETLKKLFFKDEQKRTTKKDPLVVKEHSNEKKPLTLKSIDYFIQEADELLQDFERLTLKWINSIDDMEIAAELLNNIQNLKANCSLFGYSDIEQLSHQITLLLNAVNSEANVDKIKVAKVILELKDVLKEALVDISNDGKGEIHSLHLYVELLGSLLPKGWTNAPDISKAMPRLGDILIEQGFVTPEDVASALSEQQRRLGEILIEKKAVTAKQIEEALKKQESNRPKIKLKTPEEAKASAEKIVKRQDIRVDLNKLDNLINLINGLSTIMDAIMHNTVLNNSNENILEMDALVKELQVVTTSIRKVSVYGLFQRMIRLVYDLATKLGKKVELQLTGEETELDKAVVEAITEPLIHLIRNAIDHGLEPPNERLNIGKPETGIIKLMANYENDEALIIVEDDGQGLNKEKIIAKALAEGLIKGDVSNMTEEAIFDLVFQPGFSTAEKVTDISGRGVGMDVVKQNLQEINGKIEIYSKQGSGTKIVLRLPAKISAAKNN